MMEVFLISLIVGASSGCNYASGFEMGLSNFKSGGHGYNLDRFCSTASDDEKARYKKGVDEGTSSASRFADLGISEIPQDEKALADLIAAAERRRRDEQIAEMERELERLRKETSNQKQDLKNLKQKISAQEEKIRDLKAANSASQKP